MDNSKLAAVAFAAVIAAAGVSAGGGGFAFAKEPPETFVSPFAMTAPPPPCYARPPGDEGDEWATRGPYPTPC